MSWHSTAQYYRLLNTLSEARYGRQMNAESVVVSLRFAPLVRWMQDGETDRVADHIAKAARKAEMAGADCVLLTAFTARFALSAVRASVSIPVVDAYDALEAACRQIGATHVGLLGTRHTLGAPDLTDRLRDAGIAAVLPAPPLASEIDVVIGEDLTEGNLSPRSRRALDAAAKDLAGRGADTVALVCTELPLLLPVESPLPVIDGVKAHVEHALNSLETMA